MSLKSGRMDKEKCCYDNSAFVLTEKNVWMGNEVRYIFIKRLITVVIYLMQFYLTTLY